MGPQGSHWSTWVSVNLRRETSSRSHTLAWSLWLGAGGVRWGLVCASAWSQGRTAAPGDLSTLLLLKACLSERPGAPTWGSGEPPAGDPHSSGGRWTR